MEAKKLKINEKNDNCKREGHEMLKEREKGIAKKSDVYGSLKNTEKLPEFFLWNGRRTEE